MAGPQPGGSCVALEAAWGSAPSLASPAAAALCSWAVPSRIRLAAGREGCSYLPSNLFGGFPGGAERGGDGAGGPARWAGTAEPGWERARGCPLPSAAPGCPRHRPGERCGAGEARGDSASCGLERPGREPSSLLCLLRDPERRLGACVSQLVPVSLCTGMFGPAGTRRRPLAVRPALAKGLQ